MNRGLAQPARSCSGKQWQNWLQFRFFHASAQRSEATQVLATLSAAAARDKRESLPGELTAEFTKTRSRPHEEQEDFTGILWEKIKRNKKIVLI